MIQLALPIPARRIERYAASDRQQLDHVVRAEVAGAVEAGVVHGGKLGAPSPRPKRRTPAALTDWRSWRHIHFALAQPPGWPMNPGAPSRLITVRTLLVRAALLGVVACMGDDSGARTPQVVATVALTTSAVIVQPAQTVTLTATPLDSMGHAITGRPAVWTSSQPAVATIDPTGLLTAVAEGRTTVTATIDSKSASVTIDVQLPLPPVPPAGPDTVSRLGAWELVLDRPLASKYEGLAFPDSLHGWLISDRGDILATADGGATWTQQGTKLGTLRSIDFMDNSRGFVGSLSGLLLHTTDAGATWTDIASTLPKPPIGFCGITHFGNTVHVVGRYTGATDYYSSPDGGVTWRYLNLGSMMSGLVDVSFVTATTGFISGSGPGTPTVQGNATILKTTDGGLTWRVVFTNDAGKGWAWKIFPINTGLIYASIESFDDTFRVAKSVDGGETWKIKIVATGQPVNGGVQGIGFLDANVGWIGGFFTGMFATTNGGDTWSPVPVTSGNVNRFRRAGTTLITAGTKGVLRYTPSH